jgi:hypothetical protein
VIVGIHDVVLMGWYVAVNIHTTVITGHVHNYLIIRSVK